MGGRFPGRCPGLKGDCAFGAHSVQRSIRVAPIQGASCLFGVQVPGRCPIGANLFIALDELLRKTNGFSEKPQCEHSQRIRELEQIVYKLTLIERCPGLVGYCACGAQGIALGTRLTVRVAPLQWATARL